LYNKPSESIGNLKEEISQTQIMSTERNHFNSISVLKN